MSRMPQVPAPATSVLRGARAPLFDLDVSVVTPLFGGGAMAGVADPLVPVRAASVRGHLRFWWRVCKGASVTADTPSKQVDQLFQQEESLWGSTAVPGRLVVMVETIDAGQEVACANYQPDERGGWKTMPRWRPGYPAYALFPFQGKLAPGGQEIQVLPARAREAVRFRLRIDTTPGLDDRMRAELNAAAEAALWAWFTFGGIGARTRRGCGSLYCGAAPFAPPRQVTEGQVGAWLRETATRYLALAPRRLPIPTLHGASLYTGRLPMPALQSWSHAINLMRDFRQKPDLGRNPGQQPNRPGRSRWPEADSIRRATGRSAPQHRPEHPAGNYYPRADLGLPIVFHYQSGQDPPDTILQVNRDGATRMASPIILKPLALSDKESVPLALCLDAPHVWDDKTPIHLSTTRGDLPMSDLLNHAKSAQVSPLSEDAAGRGADGAREAFMRYAGQQLRGMEIQL